MKVSTITKKIKKYLEKEDRKDIEFRILIALTELGDIAKYITHDQKLNPVARPYGIKSDEKLTYGQALVQLIAAAVLRKINIEESITLGLKNWEEGDWRKKNKKQKEISGLLVFPGNVKGKAYILSKKNPLKNLFRKSILIATMIKPDMIPYLSKVSAIITDHGGLTSHAAIIAKEFKIPCIVGTGNATRVIPHGSSIKIISKNKKRLVKYGYCQIN